MNKQFKSFVTRVAFNLTLTKPMIRALLIIDERVHGWHYDERQKIWRRGFWGYYFGGGRAGLERRGLIQYESGMYKDQQQGDKLRLGHVITLTYAGHLVAELIREGGFFINNKEELSVNVEEMPV